MTNDADLHADARLQRPDRLAELYGDSRSTAVRYCRAVVKCRNRQRNWLAAAGAGLVMIVTGCGGDESSVAAVVGGVTTCAELFGQVDFEALSAEEASLVADKMLGIATEQVADDGVIEEKMACSRIIQSLDLYHADAAEGMDLEGLEQETKESLAGDG